MAEVSFIIPSCNSHATIAKTIESIFRQSLWGHVKEIVVVDSSTDLFTRRLLYTYTCPQLNVITVDGSLNDYQKRNLGARLSQGELLCFIDSDVYVQNTWLEKVLMAYHKGINAGSGSMSIPKSRHKDPLAIAQLYLQFNDNLAVGQGRCLEVIAACNMFIEHRLFKEIGGFPEHTSYADELLSRNLIKAHAHPWLIPSARCFWNMHQTFLSYVRQHIRTGCHLLICRRTTCSDWYYKGLWPMVVAPAVVVLKIARICAKLNSAGHDHLDRFVRSAPLVCVGLMCWGIGFVGGCFAKENTCASSGNAF